MALVLMNPGVQPLGMFDGYDSELTKFKGGEVCTWVGVSTTAGVDLGAADVNDGYTGTSSQKRPAVTLTLTSTSKPLFLADDGVANYGTLFGQIVGSVAGSVSTGGTVLGPHTATGSGKITLWDKPGLYAVTLDAVDTAADGLVPTNAAMTVGKSLTYTTAGLLTPLSSTNAAGSVVVGHFAEFSTNNSLVTTPQNLVAALNSPSGGVGSLKQLSFYMAVFAWNSNL